MHLLGSEQSLGSIEKRVSLLSLCGLVLMEGINRAKPPPQDMRGLDIFLRNRDSCHFVKIKTKSHLIMMPLVLCS